MREIDRSILITTWTPPKGFPRWMREIMERHDLRNIDLIREGINPDNLQYWRYKCKRPQIWSQKQICAVLSRLSGLPEMAIRREMREALK